jgi:hypothetical protein
VFENITFISCNTENTFNLGFYLLSVIVSIIAILFTVFVSVKYSEYVNEKKNYEVVMHWYIYEIAILSEEYKREKVKVLSQLKIMKSQPKGKQVYIWFFSNRSFDSYKELHSKGCLKYVSPKKAEETFKMNDYFDKISSYQKRNEKLYELITYEGEILNYNDAVIQLFEEMLPFYDEFIAVSDAFKVPEFPSIFTMLSIKFIIISKKIINVIKK